MRIRIFSLILFFFIFIFSSSCSREGEAEIVTPPTPIEVPATIVPIQTPTEPHELLNVTPPQQASADRLLVRIRFTTTSDWTDLFLVSGATWLSANLVEADGEAITAEVITSQLVLNQSITRAEAAEQVEMTADIELNPAGGGNPLEFRIERGDIGFSQVEILVKVKDEWQIIKSVHWGELSGDGKNSHLSRMRSSFLFIPYQA